MAVTLQIDKTLANNQYTVKFSLIEITDSDNQLMDKFGEVVIDFGGAFTGPPAFSLPVNERSLRTGLPVMQVFDGNADVMAESKANVFETENRAKITGELATLRAMSDGFTLSDQVEF